MSGIVSPINRHPDRRLPGQVKAMSNIRRSGRRDIRRQLREFAMQRQLSRMEDLLAGTARLLLENSPQALMTANDVAERRPQRLAIESADDFERYRDVEYGIGAIQLIQEPEALL